MEEIEKVIGIKKSTSQSPSSNEGRIYEKLECGKWMCTNILTKYIRFLTDEEINHDLNRGYLKEM